MNWQKDRDELIAQTMAFVQSVTSRMQESSTPKTGEVAALSILDVLDSKPAPKAKPPLVPVNVAEGLRAVSSPAPRPIVASEMANEIRARIAGFRAHQERFNREREEYFNETLARLKAAINEMPPPRPGK